MFPLGKPRSVTYDANGTRASPEKHSGEVLLSALLQRTNYIEPQPRVVSDDILQRCKQPPFFENTLAGFSADSFEFQEPLRLSFSKMVTSSPQSPTCKNPTTEPSAQNSYAPIPPYRPPVSRLHSPLSAAAGRFAPEPESPGLFRSLSRVHAQLSLGRRYSSCPSIKTPVSALQRRLSSATPLPDPVACTESGITYQKERTALPGAGTLFSFSEADDLVLEVSPTRTKFLLKPSTASTLALVPVLANVPQNTTHNAPQDVPETPVCTPLHHNTGSHDPPLPPKLVASSFNSNAIGLILGTYDHSLCLVALAEMKLLASRTHPLSATSTFHLLPERYYPCESESETRPSQLKHDRHNSLSLAVSLALLSTLTSAHYNKQRFVRYAMNTQAKFATYPSRWIMDNVLGWLEMHRFPDKWKETFRRNEISGNRFLELGNYDTSSPVWRQLSHTLGADGDPAIVGRFITLLNAETQDLETSSVLHVSQPSSLDVDTHAKLENRKSSSTLWAQPQQTTTSAPAPAKQRPFSYIDPGNQKPQKEHVKFFRKHSRLLSSDSGSGNGGANGKDVPPPELSSRSKSSSEASLSLGNLGFKKSGILSTLRKYGGEKAAGIVKQVLSSPSVAGKQHSSKRMSTGFLSGLLKKPDHEQNLLVPHKRGSQGLLPSHHDDANKSPSSMHSLSNVNSDDIHVPRTAHKQGLEDVLDRQYLPVPQKRAQETGTMTILLTRDNRFFVPCAVEPRLLFDIDALKKRFLLCLDMLQIGTITYHITDFDASCGAALSNELLLGALHHGVVSKLKLELSIHSVSEPVGTFSSTSSDSESFEMSAGGEKYPATPQYLLQQSHDKAVDYMNFKDSSRHFRVPARDTDLPLLPLYESVERIHTAPRPLNLAMPQLRKVHANNVPVPSMNKRGLPLINTSHPPVLSGLAPDASTESPGSSFTVVRRACREIDFDKRRMNPHESKAPRIIPNIYSSSVADSTVSPISVSTIHALHEDKSDSPGTISQVSRDSSIGSMGSEADKGACFVARRKAPPPPTASNSLKVSKKKSTSSFSFSFSALLGSHHLSNESIGSFGNSQVGTSTNVSVPSKKFDFSDAPSLEIPTTISRGDSRNYHVGDDDDDDDDDVFFKPLPVNNSKTSGQEHPAKATKRAGANNDLVGHTDSMKMRPSVDEVYDNLEKYFPNTILDKPIIDAYPESPKIAAVSNSVASSKPAPSRPPISRTFSNANKSPVCPLKESEDEIFYGDGPRLRRMKTIRAVAKEAHKKRLASQKAVKGLCRPIQKQQAVDYEAVPLTRTNTKLWGQRVVEVTSDDIEKGIVGRIRKTANKTYEEFAWVKGGLIGRGSFGSVFLALNVTTGEMLAVKQVNVNESARPSSEALDAFHKEVETMKDLDHLNIVQYLGFEQSKLTYSLFLEYVAGGSVSSCLKSYGKFDEPLVKFITRQVLEGLKHLHENRILHRDLKADNLLLEINGVCKISDFGISKRSQDIYSNNAEMSMQGTVFWMAPEVIHSMVEEKKQGYSAKVDIWSLGCVMLEMFAGQRPWSNEAVVSAIYKLGKTKLAPPIPAHVSQEAKDFLNQCFTIDSEKRPTAAELLHHEFMRPDSGFQFSQTRLSAVIKSNSTKNMVKK